jgi:predicted MFS family arabinose efflux permease
MDTVKPPRPGPALPVLSKKLLFVLAACAGASVANLYYAQPLLALIARSLDAAGTVGLVAVATQVGYTLGILFILPLGDLVERRRLTAALAAVLVLASLACACAPTLWTLAAACVFVGVGATITQFLVPFAADLSEPERRADAIGVVFSGILGGILLARTISGTIGEALGWRPMFAVAAAVALVLGLVLFKSLPRTAPKTTESYGALLKSMLDLLARHRKLRVACTIQALLFAVFSAFWSVLALLLASPQFGLGATAAGAFGLIGLVGVGAANLSGRLLARFGTGPGLLLALACCVASYVVFMADVSLRGLVVGVVLLDFGLSIANVANQSTILGLEPAASSRVNTIYVTAIFLGGTAGSAIAAAAWAQGGWSAVAAFGLAAAVLAFGIHGVGMLRRQARAARAK